MLDAAQRGGSVHKRAGGPRSSAYPGPEDLLAQGVLHWHFLAGSAASSWGTPWQGTSVTGPLAIGQKPAKSIQMFLPELWGGWPLLERRSHLSESASQN